MHIVMTFYAYSMLVLLWNGSMRQILWTSEWWFCPIRWIPYGNALNAANTLRKHCPTFADVFHSLFIIWCRYYSVSEPQSNLLCSVHLQVLSKRALLPQIRTWTGRYLTYSRTHLCVSHKYRWSKDLVIFYWRIVWSPLTLCISHSDDHWREVGTTSGSQLASLNALGQGGRALNGNRGTKMMAYWLVKCGGSALRTMKKRAITIVSGLL